MNQRFTLLALALAAAALSCQNLHHGEDDDGEETEIRLDQVPAAVMAAARQAVPGIVIEEACTETEDGVLVYCLEGEAAGKDYELDVAADGRVLDVEAADDEDDVEEEEEEDED